MHTVTFTMQSENSCTGMLDVGTGKPFFFLDNEATVT